MSLSSKLQLIHEDLQSQNATKNNNENLWEARLEKLKHVMLHLY